MLSLEIITPEGLALQEDVYEVILPTPEGQIAILPHHVPLITIASAGVISIRRHSDNADEQIEHLATTGGFVEIDGKRVRVLADKAERAEDIDELKASEALSRAREIQQTHKDQVALADAVGLIELNTARLKVAELKRRKKAR